MNLNTQLEPTKPILQVKSDAKGAALKKLVADVKESTQHQYHVLVTDAHDAQPFMLL